MLNKLRKFFTSDQETPVDEEIAKVLQEMDDAGVMSNEYPMLLKRLRQLYRIKASERQTYVSRDTIALIAGNLLGILLIVAYEQKHVMTSKGINQIIRPR